MNDYIIKTPFTSLKISCNDDAVTSVDFVDQSKASTSHVSGLMADVKKQVNQYCQQAQGFKLSLQPQGTDFQKKVWVALQKIPAGKVKTYGEIARDLKTSPRAVGNACRKNPIPLFIPCHRVVSQTGIGGFAGATEGEYLDIKRQLLRHEGVEI